MLTVHPLDEFRTGTLVFQTHAIILHRRTLLSTKITKYGFSPHPTASKYTFEGVGVLKPSLSATGVEDFIFETHGRSIACGAIWRLTIIPGKEWSNPEVAMYYKTEFYKHMDAAKGRDTRRVNLRIASVGFDRASAGGRR
jgi:hypothetical protein